jgi:hypothetical protein
LTFYSIISIIVLEVAFVKNPYKVLGIILSVAGAVMAPVFYYFFMSVPLTAVALSSIILGLASFFLASARPYISPEASQILLKAGMENTAALLEEIGIRNKAIYLPAKMRDGYPQAIIPIREDCNLQSIRDKLPGRLIVRYGPRADDMAIAVTTPGSINLEMLENAPGPSAYEIEAAIGYILTGVLDIANGVKVDMTDSRVNIEVRNAKMGYEEIWYYYCLGSPIASITAAISSEALQKPIRIFEEKYHKGKYQIVLEVLS